MINLRSLSSCLEKLRAQIPQLEKICKRNPNQGVLLAAADLRLLLEYIGDLEGSHNTITLEEICNNPNFKPSMRNGAYPTK